MPPPPPTSSHGSLKKKKCSPSGKPASVATEASSIAAPGHFSEGFMTNVFPAATARGNIHRGIMAGKLNGQMPSRGQKWAAAGARDGSGAESMHRIHESDTLAITSGAYSINASDASSNTRTPKRSPRGSTAAGAKIPLTRYVSGPFSSCKQEDQNGGSHLPSKAGTIGGGCYMTFSA